jgi:uncharacterized protein (UPF0333 family)
MIKNKAQMSMEFLFISFLSMVMLIPIMYVFFDYTATTSRDIILTQTYNAARAIVDVSEQVWAYGEDGIQTVEVTFPKSLLNMTIEQNSTLVIYTGLRTSVVAIPSSVPIWGNFTPEDVNPGTRKFRMENVRGEFVLIERINRTG